MAVQITIELGPEQLYRLTEVAQERGQSIEDVATDVIERACSDPGRAAGSLG